ncbi:MAG: type II toxin-antitoxin system VapC family toxin [Acidobacteriota bacterium]
MPDCLLDTSTFIWMVREPHRLPTTVQTLIQNTPALYLSAASIWEIVVKAQRHGIAFGTERPSAWIRRQIDVYSLRILPITGAHAMAVEDLPMHHKDPFDRILAAQALTGGLTLLTCDPELVKYPIETAW